MNAVTWGYATLCWTYLITDTGIPQRILLQRLMSFDLLACYLDTSFGPEMEYGCRNAIKRVAFPSRPATVISKITDKL